MSISGEDHGLKSIGKWTKAVKAVSAAREGGNIQEEKRLDNHHPQTLLWTELLKLIFMANTVACIDLIIRVKT